MTASPPAAVVVLHWGRIADTMACVASVAASSRPAAPLVVVDNGTGVLDAGAIAALVPGARVITLPTNAGFTGGANVGIRHALDAGAAFVLLLNNDATLAPDALEQLVRVATATARIGAVGAKVLTAERPDVLWAAWMRVTYRAALVELVGRGAPDGPAWNVTRDVEAVPGCAMLLSRDALEAVGLLDDAFFAYHEDLDWCVRARARGFRIVFAPAARVFHRGEGSLAPRGAANPARYLSARNSVLFARKHAGVGARLALAAAVAASLPGEWLRQRRGGDVEVVRLLLRGYRDGLLGRDLPLAALGLR